MTAAMDLGQVARSLTEGTGGGRLVLTADRDRDRVVVSLAAATFVALTVLAWTGDYVP
ncbi:MAG: hypothetical protein KY464_07765 [Gemmatimonadetes bacterium]|nr:hypothetical protein [Gemmatimonadota bacterium]